MSQPVVVVTSEETPTPVSHPTPNDPPAEIVTAIHDDAMMVGGLIERVNTLETRIVEVESQVQILAGNQAAAIALTDQVMDVVEDVQETVEELATETEPAPVVVEEQPEDTPPGKSHWLHRSGREWRGKE